MTSCNRRSSPLRANLSAMNISTTQLASANRNLSYINLSGSSLPGADFSGHQATEQSTVTVVDTMPPVLTTLDLADPSQPAKVAEIVTPSGVAGLFLSGRLLLVADEGSGLRIIDISDPMNPQEVGFFDTPGNGWGVAVMGDLALVADLEAGLTIVDLSPFLPQAGVLVQ